MATLRSLRRIALLLGIGSFSLLTVDSAFGETDDVAAAKKQCLTAHEQSQVLKQSAKLRETREALLQCSRDVCPSFVRADCVEWLAQLDKVMPSVVVSARVNKKDEFAVRVFVDGALVTPKLDGKSIELNPGLHNFRFETAGWPPLEQQVLVAEGEKNRTVLAQFGAAAEDNKSEPQIPTHRPFPTIDYVLTGTALAGLGMFIGFGKSGQSARDDLSKTCQPFCADSEISKVRTKLVLADVGLGVAVVSTVLGVVLYATRPAIPLATEEKKKPGAIGATTFGITPTAAGAFVQVQTEL